MKFLINILLYSSAFASDSVGTLVDGIDNKSVIKISPDKGHVFRFHHDVLVMLPTDKKYSKSYLSGFVYGYMDGMLVSAQCRLNIESDLTQDWING